MSPVQTRRASAPLERMMLGLNPLPGNWCPCQPHQIAANVYQMQILGHAGDATDTKGCSDVGGVLELFDAAAEPTPEYAS